jgi:multiple sugar transport system permease protein
MIVSLYFAFTEYNVLKPPEWVGLSNFERMFSEDKLFLTSLGNTVYFVLLSVPFNLIVAFGMALLLQIEVRGINVFRTLYYLPVLTPAVASALTWSLIFSSDGILNSILRLFGLETVNWLFDPNITKLVFVGMGFWTTGTTAIIFLAGLQNISQSLYDAASIDGAGVLKRFRYVTMPMMTPYIFFNLVLGIISSFQIFVPAYIITNGGPLNSTLFYVLHMYNEGFRFLHMGYASAMAWVLFLIIIVFTIIQFRLARRWVFYEVST